MNKDVHTEHCCKYHSCKYGDEDCPVVLNQKKQSFPCEYCQEIAFEPLSLRRRPYFKMTGCVNDGGKCIEVKDRLAGEVSTLFRCGVNEENQFYLECPNCLTLFSFGYEDFEEIPSLMQNHGNDTCWYGRKGEKYSPTYEV